MPLSAKQLYQGAIHHAVHNARKGREREYALFFVRTVGVDLRARKMYSSALVADALLKEMYELGLEQKYGLCACCYEKLRFVAPGSKSGQPPHSNTGATPQQLDILENYV